MSLLKKILVCDEIEEEGINKLREAGFIVHVNPTISAQELKTIVKDYHVLVVRSRTKVTKEIIEAAENLKIIGRAGAGVDNIDVKAAEGKGINVLNTPEAPANAVAELTFGLLLCLARKISQADAAMKQGRWIKKDLKGWELKGKTIGIIGLGNIGEKVAKIAKAFEMKILITKRTPPPPELLKELQAEFVSLTDLLRRSDIITIHVPLTPQTQKMIGETEFQLMKNGAILINTSRGAIVDEKALFKALQSQKLGGAAIDVFEVEPPLDYALAKLSNVVCTPHIGAQTEEAQKLAATLIAEKIITALDRLA